MEHACQHIRWPHTIFHLPSLFCRIIFLGWQSEVASKQAACDNLAAQIGDHEARAQGGGAVLRGEYQVLEKAVGTLRRERDNLQQDQEISNMNPKEVGMTALG